MKDKSKLIAIVLAIAAISVIIFSVFFGNKDNKTESSDAQIVTNYSNFYTVNSCAYRVITYLGSKDADNMMLVLNDTYKQKNKVKQENVLSLFPTVEEGSTFVSTKMYYKKLSSKLTKYYVKRYIEKNVLNELNNNNLEKVETYFIIYLDSESQLFSIEPYSGELFIGGEQNGK